MTAYWLALFRRLWHGERCVHCGRRLWFWQRQGWGVGQGAWHSDLHRGTGEYIGEIPTWDESEPLIARWLDGDR